MIVNCVLFDNLTYSDLCQILSTLDFSKSLRAYPTSNCLIKGEKNGIFCKELNLNKISKLYYGDYLLLFKKYYIILKQILPVNNILGLAFINNSLYEFSENIDKIKFLDEGNNFEFWQIRKLFNKILYYINNVLAFKEKSGIDISFETAIWNFTIDGLLFDLDPPKLLLKHEDSTFTRKEDENHKKRTIYRSFNEIGMKTNLLVTFILGMKHNSFIVKDLPSNYLGILIDDIIISINNIKVKQKFLKDLTFGISKDEKFLGHPIEIIREEKKMMENFSKKRIIFVAGTSESGKSGAINYLKDTHNCIQHIKIRDVFPKVYADTASALSFEEWQDYEENRDLNNFWRLFVNKLSEMVDQDKDIIILDTMYGVDGMKELYKILQNRVELLYIDAPIEMRIIREYNRLRTNSIRGTRKADLSITIEEVTERTLKKDEKKNKKGANLLKKLVYSCNSNELIISDNGIKFPYIVENDGTLEEFYIKLDNYIEYVLSKDSQLGRQKKWN